MYDEVIWYIEGVQCYGNTNGSALDGPFIRALCQRHHRSSLSTTRLLTALHLLPTIVFQDGEEGCQVKGAE